MSPRPRVLIADDHIFVAQLCKRLLETEFEVIGTVRNGRAMVRAAREQKPDVIIVDIAMPVLNGLDAGQRIKAAFRTVKLIYLTMNPDPQVAAEAFCRGGSAYLLKTCAAAELVMAVREVLQGKSYVSLGLPKHSVDYFRRNDKGFDAEEDRLTKREREVLQLIAEGKLMREIADTLHMKIRTVAFHKYRMMEVLGVTSTAELVRYAVRRHVVAA